jgi:hypothetical protein
VTTAIKIQEGRLKMLGKRSLPPKELQRRGRRRKSEGGGRVREEMIVECEIWRKEDGEGREGGRMEE